jgi:hypothetical protein
VFFLIQDYAMGRSGGSSFKQRDVLLMPRNHIPSFFRCLLDKV